MSARRHKNFTRGLSFSKYTQREDWEGGKAGREERLEGRVSCTRSDFQLQSLWPLVCLQVIWTTTFIKCSFMKPSQRRRKKKLEGGGGGQAKANGWIISLVRILSLHVDSKISNAITNINLINFIKKTYSQKVI